jgi:ribonuclease HI
MKKHGKYSENEVAPKFTIYTDGASTIKSIKAGDTLHRLFYGGWAFIVIENGFVSATGSGGGRFKTGQAELCAIGAAYAWLAENGHRGCRVKFKTDSQYAIRSMIELIHRDNDAIDRLANPHILKRLKTVVDNHGEAELARYYHVKGHGNSEFNNMADNFAVSAKLAFMGEWHVQDLDAIEAGSKPIPKPVPPPPRALPVSDVRLPTPRKPSWRQ